MKVFLLHPERDIDLDAPLPPNEAELTQDLELTTLFTAMAPGDEVLRDVARRVLLDQPDRVRHDRLSPAGARRLPGTARRGSPDVRHRRRRPPGVA